MICCFFRRTIFAISSCKIASLADASILAALNMLSQQLTQPVVTCSKRTQEQISLPPGPQTPCLPLARFFLPYSPLFIVHSRNWKEKNNPIHNFRLTGTFRPTHEILNWRNFNSRLPIDTKLSNRQHSNSRNFSWHTGTQNIQIWFQNFQIWKFWNYTHFQIEAAHGSGEAAPGGVASGELVNLICRTRQWGHL